MTTTNHIKTLGASMLLLALTANVASAGNPNPTVLPPFAKSYGLSYAEWSVKWWQWVFSLPATNNPELGTGDCSVGQSGSVWFLPGSFSPTTKEVGCTIPPGKALFFPVFNAWGDNTGCPNWTDYTAQELVDLYTEPYMDSNPTVACTVDGVAIANLSPVNTSLYRVGPQAFGYTLAQTDNILASFFGATCIANGTYVYPAVEDGVYLMLAPLSAGEHTIHVVVEGFLDLTYKVTVQK